MSTPRTDAACGWPWGHHGRIETADLRWSQDGPFVHSSVARDLERENVALRACVDRTGEANDRLVVENATLRKQLEQWEQSTQWFSEWAEKKQELERENAALRKEKDRLDWLITKAPFCVLSTLSSDPAAARLKIDREMEFPTV